MKHYSLVFLLCLSTTHVCFAQQTDNMHIIIDGRQPLKSEDQSTWLTHPAILQAANLARSYWLKQNTVYQEDFRIMASSQGNFTRSESRQSAVLYLLSRWPRCCSNMGLAIIEDNQLVRNIVFAGGTHHLFSVADFNHDQLDELALVSSFGMGGSNETTLRIISLPARETVLLGTMPLAYDNCATLREDSLLSTFRISINNDAVDKIELEEFQADCEHPEDVMVTSVKSIMIETKQLNDEYIDLPIN
jgi:hypothetical protein